ncbi:hypothetical protein ABSS59_004861, partial [Salmonella enterica subsp. enterica serovar 1,4,[5],12:i:-]
VTVAITLTIMHSVVGKTPGWGTLVREVILVPPGGPEIKVTEEVQTSVMAGAWILIWGMV